MESNKKILCYILIGMILLVISTGIVIVLKPKMHTTFNIQKLVIKKVVK